MSYYNKKEKKFEQKMIDIGLVPNLFAAVMIAFYFSFFAGFSERDLSVVQTVAVIGMVALIIFFLQFVASPISNHLITKKLSEDLEHRETFDAAKRTEVVRALMRMPMKITIEVFIWFLFGSIMFGVGLIAFLDFEIQRISCCLIPSIYASFIASVMAYCYSENMCSEYNFELLKKEVDKKRIKKDRIYGMRMYVRVLYHVILPIIFVSIIQFQNAFTQIIAPIDDRKYLLSSIILLVFNMTISIVIAVLFFRHIYNSVKQINSILEHINSGNISSSISLPTDLGTELAYTTYIINNLISDLQKKMSDVKTTSANLFAITQDLSVSSKETETTAFTQSSSVYECLEKMNSVNNLLVQIGDNISRVSVAALETLDNVNAGSDILQKNIEKITEITQANLDTITGIKNVSEKIDNVWTIINNIDAIAEKTRVIAFNTEIEATTAGDNGENFHIVANEIRRLASTITDSTKEIKSRITDIQHSSDNLIITSEGGTEKIREGSILFTDLEEKFNNLRMSSEVTSESAKEIEEITTIQDAAFRQVSSTFEQLSEGFRNFTQSAQTISNSAETIKNAAYRLSSIQTMKEGE